MEESSPARGNLISGNGLGIQIDGSAATENLIAGNTIGLDVNGTTALGNATEGVWIANGASDNTIGGGMTAQSRNVISGNAGQGLVIDGSTGNLVTRNYIGTDINGMLPFPMPSVE